VLKLSQSHPTQRRDDAALPFLRQHRPNRRRRTFAHRGIQANAPGRSALGIQLSVIRRISSIYQRHCQWHIELGFKRLKSLIGLKGPPGFDERSARPYVLVHLLIILLLEPLVDGLEDSPPVLAAA
jgi:hypothetical protein